MGLSAEETGMADPLLVDLLEWHDRLLIAGVPWSGKSTLAARVTYLLVVHPDDFCVVGWVAARMWAWGAM